MTSSDDALSGAENRMNKTTTQNEPARQALRKTFSVSEFMAFGERYGIDYRFPQLLQKPEPPHASPVLRGEVEEMTLPCGMCVTHSDVHVLQPYETTSRHSSPLYMLVVLEGCVALTLNGELHLVRSGMAFTSRLNVANIRPCAPATMPTAGSVRSPSVSTRTAPGAMACSIH